VYVFPSGMRGVFVRPALADRSVSWLYENTGQAFLQVAISTFAPVDTELGERRSAHAGSPSPCSRRSALFRSRWITIQRSPQPGSPGPGNFCCFRPAWREQASSPACRRRCHAPSTGTLPSQRTVGPFGPVCTHGIGNFFWDSTSGSGRRRVEDADRGRGQMTAWIEGDGLDMVDSLQTE
jgi:hypothetical protein